MEAQEEELRSGTLSRKYDMEFHRLMANACRNPVLSIVVTAINDAIQDAIYRSKLTREMREQVVGSHRELFESIAAGDPERAGRIMAEHVVAVQRQVSENRPRAVGNGRVIYGRCTGRETCGATTERVIQDDLLDRLIGERGPMIYRLSLPLILGAVLSAQVPDLKAVLNLSDSQIQSLVQLQQQKPQTLQPLVQQMEQDQQKLQQLLGTNPDPAAVGRLVIEINTIRGQVQQVVSSFQQQALNILLPDQRNQVQSLGEVLRLHSAAQQAVALGLLTPPN